MKRCLSLLTAALIALSMLAGCADSARQSISAPTQAPRVVGDYVRTADIRTITESTADDARYRIPEILLSGDDAERMNAEIAQLCRTQIGEGEVSSCSGIDYLAFLNNDILSVAVTLTYEGGGQDSYVCNLDVMTGEGLDNEGLCEKTGRLYDVVLMSLERLAKEDYEKRFSEEIIQEELYDKTFSNENLQRAELYLGEDGHLCAAFTAYIGAGSGRVLMNVVIE